MLQVVAVFVVTRVALLLTIVAALGFLSPAPPCPGCHDASADPLLGALANWDGAAYLEIARSGYARLDPSYAAYFPLYPLLMGVGGLIGGINAYIIAGLIVSNAACLAAAVMLTRLARDGDAVALRAAVYLLIFPTTVFLSALYADSLFIALAIGSAFAARRSWWWGSGALAAAATLTRPFGGLAVIPLAVALWRARATLGIRSALPLALAPAAFAVWVAYLYSVTGDPLAVVHGYTSGFTPRQPLQAFTDLLDPSVYGFPWLVAASFALFVALTVVSWRRTDPGLSAYATAIMLVIGAAGSLTSSMRYELSVYPAFLALASGARAPAAHIVWCALSALLALFFAAMFALGYWVG